LSPCFVDTFFFLALLNPKDRVYHTKAREANRIDRPAVTSMWVLLELADHLCDVHNRHLFHQLLEAIRTDPRYEVVAADPKLLDEAVRLYIDRPDKGWSLTDCTSFLIMRKRKIKDALTADHHFEQAGFHALLA
jgi:predicted nucleic acid-binding protein